MAAQVGDHLRAIDERIESHRDDSMAIAFPETGQHGGKGRLRYQNHFVGQMIKGEQKGLMVGLKLATMDVKRNRPFIMPTLAGWEFSKLANPVLDSDRISEPVSLGTDEITFLIEHIREHVPAELFAYRLLLTLIDSGVNTPDCINKAIHERAAGQSIEFSRCS